MSGKQVGVLWDGGDQGWGLNAGRGGGNMVGEESDWKVGSPWT